MASITMQSQVDEQGNLSVALPESFRGAKVTVVVQAYDLDPFKVLQQTAGSIPDLERPPQGEHETRLPL